MATINNNFQYNVTGTIGNVVFQKNGRIRIRKNQGKRNRRIKIYSTDADNIT